MSVLRGSGIPLRVDSIASSDLRKSDRTRKAILESALEFLWSRPFRELTVAELMSPTGASRSTFYQYFTDLHRLMETLLQGIEDDGFEAAAPWFSGEGDPVVLLDKTMAGIVQLCYERGPILRAVTDAAVSDRRFERAWDKFLGKFDDAVTARIEQHQAEGLIEAFDARPVAVALNRLDVSLVVHAFGRRPRGKPEEVHEAITRIWTSTLYGRTKKSRGRSAGYSKRRS
jgi:AcrR family transcriptional regulator